MFEAIFIGRSIQFHKDMKYHAMDNDTNYAAANLDLLVSAMASDGALFEDSDDGFTVTLLENRVVVGTGLLIEGGLFRVILKNGDIQDHDLSRLS